MSPKNKTLAGVYLLTYLLISSYEVTRIQKIFIDTFKWTETIALYTGITILALILFFAFASKRFSQFIAVLTCVLLISTSAKPAIDEIGKPPELETENTDEYKDIPKSTCASWDKKCLSNYEIEIAPLQQYNKELLEKKTDIKNRNKARLEKGATTDYQEVANKILGILFVSIVTSFGVYYTAHEFAKIITAGAIHESHQPTDDQTTNNVGAIHELHPTNTVPTNSKQNKPKTQKTYPTDEVIIALYKSGRTQESLYKEFGHRKRIEQILAPIKQEQAEAKQKTTIIETEPNLFETNPEQNKTTDEQNNVIQFKKKAS